MIRPEPFEQDGRKGVMVFLDKDMQPVEPDDPSAVVSRAVFDDGGYAVYRVEPPAEPTALRYREKLSGTWRSEDRAAGIMDMQASKGRRVGAHRARVEVGLGVGLAVWRCARQRKQIATGLTRTRPMTSSRLETSRMVANS